MIVAILPQGVGKIAVIQFRDAVDEAAAVTAFCNDCVPPRNPSDYLGYDTGWASYQQTDPDKYWAYDFSSPGLVQVAVPQIVTGAEKDHYQKPKDLLIYYGWLNSFNSATCGWNNEKVAQEMSKYEIVVFGDGVADPSHGDYANTIIIIPRLKELRPDIKIFGYVATTEVLADFKTKVDQWFDLEVYGIFVDAAGYDYGTPATNGRDVFNEKIDYVHNKAYCNVVFANAWNSDHILGTADDPSYPNSTWNPSLHQSHLGEYDYVLLESFPINTSVWSPGYEDKDEWHARGEKLMDHRETYGVNLVGVGIIDNGNAAGQDMFDFGYISALAWALSAFGTSDTNYASGSSQVDWWTRPDVSGLEEVWNLNPSVQADVNDVDVYWRFVKSGKLMLDFSTGAQASSITKW
jgi:hypothetical protein